MSRPLGSRYRLESVLGRGATGEVWRAVDTDGNAYACKVLHESLAGDPATVQGFLRERSILTGLTHPGLVRVHDLVVEGGTLAIVMDLVPGTDLRTALASGPPPSAEVCRLGAEAAAGLAAVHAAGVVHRDIKPENILLDQSVTPPAAKLTDFGIAQLAEPSRTGRSTLLVGTPHYVAPEIFAGQAPGPAADLYALGIVLYELCCGVPPFTGSSALAVLRQHVDHVPARPEGIPEPLWQLIARLLDKDPAHRPGRAGQVAQELTALAHDLAGLPPAPALATPPQPVALVHRLPTEISSPPPAGRRRPLVAAAAAGAVLVAAMCGWAVGRTSAPGSSAEPGPPATSAAEQIGQQVPSTSGQPPPASPTAVPGTVSPTPEQMSDPVVRYEGQTIRLPSPERCTTQGADYQRYGASWLDLDDPRVDVEDFPEADLIYFPCGDLQAGLLVETGQFAGYGPDQQVGPVECENAARTNRIDEPLPPPELEVGDTLCVTTDVGAVARMVLTGKTGSATFSDPSSLTFSVTLWSW